jgi:hypothetical protein
MDLLFQTENLLQVTLYPNPLSILESRGKAISLQAWTGPEGSWNLRVPDFKTIGI